MSIEAELKTLVEADDGVGGAATLLTGGIYTREELGKAGFKSANPACSAAFQNVGTKKILLPSVVIKVRSQTPTYQRIDVPSMAVSVRGVVEFWFYDEDDYTVIRQAANRVYGDPDDENAPKLMYGSIPNVGFMKWINRIDNMRDEKLFDAALLRDDYSIKFIQKGGL